jgi:glycosyltransferase domain-containing protein
MNQYKMSNFSLVIPTRNRPNRLRRLLDYYDKYGKGFNIIIADSSSNDNKKLNKKSVLIFSNLDIHYIDKYPSKIESSHKINNALNYVNTKYSVLCADDDFIIPNGINKSVDFLEKNSDFSVAQGKFIAFSIKNNDKKGTK